ncbi:MAG: hypothetical protein EAZ74_01100 [Alphaproteobacteria bacterium]|nr:MAG: hypothetical protein EAZ74_01100 [Alphaproteobacteria bacterium]TAF76997.1 MAG: hypothetical protein EAZ52_02430 [Alphaproteobacteria bacterium]
MINYEAIAPMNFSKGDIRRAGKLLKRTELRDTEEYRKAQKLVQTWRGYYLYPMNTLQKHVRNQLKHIGQEPYIGQRLKRLPTIIDKLSRIEGTLETMQDIGGMRVLCDDVASMDALMQRLEKSRARHKIKRTSDYITTPTPKGYRSKHIIYEVYSSSSKTPDFLQGMTVELQVRTNIQHDWATAVEVVDMVYDSSLKTGSGPDEWKQFFLLASAIGAHLEGLPRPTPYEHSTAEELARCLINDTVMGNCWRSLVALQVITPDVKNLYYHVLATDYEDLYEYVSFSDKEEAIKAYNMYESMRPASGVMNVVLVEVDGKNLAKMYKNYFHNVSNFVQILNEFVHEHYEKKTTLTHP